MTTIRLTKQQIIDAIVEEPLLYANNWFRYKTERDGPIDIDRPPHTINSVTVCSACAVGAVLRRVLHGDQPAGMVHRAAEEAMGRAQVAPGRGDNYFPMAMELISLRSYMAALSMFFEGRWREDSGRYIEDIEEEDIENVRTSTVRFVEANFPDTIDVNINGALPAEGIQVVE